MKRYLALVLLVALFPAPAITEDTKVAFSVNLTKDGGATEQLSDQFIYRLKEEIRKSSQLQLVQNDDQAVYSVNVRTISFKDESRDPSMIVFSATLTVKDARTGQWVYSDQNVGYLGRERVQDLAAGLMVWIDNNTEFTLKYREASILAARKQCKD